MRRDRPVAAGELVVALRARLDARQAPRDREVDGAVVADLEVQERVVLDAAPVAAIKTRVADQVERARDGAAIAARHHEQDALREALAEKREELTVEIGAAPFARPCVHVKAEKGVPMRFPDIPSAQGLDR